MSGFLWAVLGVLIGLGMTALGDMVSEEVRDRLDHLPQAVLRLAARRLDPAQRISVYEDEWLPELTYILKGDEARPITRLFHGTRYALGILTAARRISRQLDTVTGPGACQAIVTLQDASIPFVVEAMRGMQEDTAEVLSVAVERRLNGTFRRRVIITLADGRVLHMSHSEFEGGFMARYRQFKINVESGDQPPG